MISTSLFDHSRTVDTLCIMILLLCILFVYHFLYQIPLNENLSHLQKYAIDEDGTSFIETVDVKKLKLKLQNINKDQNISNINKYIPMDNETPILLVQVHKDVRRLQLLVVSLSNVRDIQNTLLIFSHSYHHETINRLIDAIDFCKVMQIYYPFSLQLNPNKFPGIDVYDCLPRTEINERCVIRDARLTESKQHWWWKANFVFNKMAWSHKHEAPVIFLEENNYVAPDLLHMLQYAQRSIQYFPKACMAMVEVLSFGRSLTKAVDMNLLILEPWRPPFDVGLAFNKSTWNKIQTFTAQFCMYNDQSWSYSLLNLFKNFPNGHASMVACMTPRVLSTKEFVGSKSMLHKFGEHYNPSKLFPEKVSAVFLFGRDGMVERAVQATKEGNGGWNDLRDQVLCLDPLFSTTTEEKRYDETEFTPVID